MRPVATVAEVRAADADALQETDQSVLVARAGTVVAREALALLGSGYGRRVTVVVGKGNNGADGRVAAAHLGARGARVSVVAVQDAPDPLVTRAGADLVIDAAFGTGFRGEYRAPSVPVGVPVLAADIPSGVDGDTGIACGAPLRADLTVTFAALKPGLLQGDGPLLAGRVVVADIGLDPGRSRIALVEDHDVADLLAPRPRTAHKWQSAVAVVAGSPGMTGAAELCARGAYRAGAGMVRLGVPSTPEEPLPGGDAVSTRLSTTGWAADALAMADRCRAVVLGPGLGRDPATADDVRSLLAGASVPVVVDADGLFALATGDDAAAALRAGASGTILTPHDGEFARLAGAAPGADRIAATRALAARLGAVVLLKGPTTVVAEPDGRVLLATSGSPRLATAGTGDVLAGVIAAFVARGLPLLEAAALGAHVHGAAAALGPHEGLLAADVADLVGRWLSGVRRG